MRKRQADTLITRMVRDVVRRFRPERVLLFGSRARGDQRPDSDVDLLVVMPVAESRRKSQLEIRGLLHRYLLPADVFVKTPEDFGWRKEIPGTIERPAALEGKVLYARS